MTRARYQIRKRFELVGALLSFASVPIAVVAAVFFPHTGIGPGLFGAFLLSGLAIFVTGRLH